MPRPNSKTRKWEKERRDRLKEDFTKLSTLLPCYDPSITISKSDILQKAALLIKELQEKLDKLITTSNNPENTNTAKDDLIKKLYERIRKLLTRNEQLCMLLKDAGIRIPSACGTVKKFNSLCWSEKISPEQATLLQKKELEKENANVKKLKSKVRLKKVSTTSVAPKHRKVVNRTVKVGKKKGAINKNANAPTSKCIIVLPQTSSTQPCYIIAPSQPVIKTTNSTVMTNSGLLTPLVSSNVKSSISTILTANNSMSTLGPGTLILANGTIVPVIPQTKTVLPAPTIINTITQPKPTVIVMPKTTTQQPNVVSPNNLPGKNLVKLKPKCLTLTTQINKVPIPALTSRYATTTLVLSDNKRNLDTKKNVNKTEIKKDVSKGNQKRKLGEISKVDSKKVKVDVKKIETVKLSEASTVKETKLTPEITKEGEFVKNVLEDKTNDDKDSSKIVDGDLNEIQPSPVVETINEDVTKQIDDQTVSIQDEKVLSGTSEVADKTSSPEKISNNSNQTNTISEINLDIPISNSSEVSNKTLSNIETVPVQEIKTLDLNLPHSELSNDIFATLQESTGCQNPESTSPTAAFLLAFPLVSSLNGVKVTEVIDEDNVESQRETPTLLQIGTMDNTKATQSASDNLNSNFLNLDNFSFFTNKDVCSSFYNSYSNAASTITTSSAITTVAVTSEELIVKPNSQINYNINREKIKISKDDNSSSTNNKIGNHGVIYDRRIEGSTVCNNNNNNNTDHNQSSISTNISNCDVMNKVATTLQNPQNKNVTEKLTYNNHSNSKSYNQCNFGAFTDSSIITTTCSYPSFTKTYTAPLYTNNTNYGYNYHSDTNFNQNYYKNIPKSDSRSYYSLNYDNYSDYRKTESSVVNNYYSGSQTYLKDKVIANSAGPKVNKNAAVQNKAPINWMTTPDNKLQTSSDYILPNFPSSKESDFNHSSIYHTNSFVPTTQTNYFTTSTMYNSSADVNNSLTVDSRKTLELPLMPINSHQRSETEENQFSWSPSKIPQYLEPSHSFTSSTLPTLVGDLALTFGEQKNENKFSKEPSRKDRRLKTNNYENNSTFLSVSQLVDHNKPESNTSRNPRRTSGNRLKNTNNIQTKTKRTPKLQENKESCSNTKLEKRQVKSGNSNFNIMQGNQEMFCEQQQKCDRTITKNSTSCSNYSAESLIGHQMQPDPTMKRQNYPTSNKSLVPSFLTDNIIPYFPPVDLPQENNYMQQNQNYQSNTFSHNFSTSFQNNSYTPNTFIPSVSTTTTYLPNNNFIHDIGSHDYQMTENLPIFSSTNNSKDNKSHKNFNRQNDKMLPVQNSSCSNNNSKKIKKKQHENIPGLEFPFLSMSSTINSPILPDDFHSHTSFLPPPSTPYSCKNSLYPKQNTDLTSGTLLPLHGVPGARTSIQHPEISPSLTATATNSGTSLTNFNLSAIFPEINKSHLSDGYTESRHKEQGISRSYPTTSSIQVPFSNVNKPPINFTSYNNL